MTMYDQLCMTNCHFCRTVCMCILLPVVSVFFLFQGKGMQKTYWLDGRKGLSLPLLSSQVDVKADEPALGVQTTDDD